MIKDWLSKLGITKLKAEHDLVAVDTFDAEDIDGCHEDDDGMEYVEKCCSYCRVMCVNCLHWGPNKRHRNIEEGAKGLCGIDRTDTDQSDGCGSFVCFFDSNMYSSD